MIKEQPYRPHPLHISADFERADTCAPRSSMNPHPGICPACATATGYRYASPIGERHHSVTGHAQWVHTAADRTGSPTTANYSLLTANWESHLGSSSWITHTDSHAVQHLHYLPWGEDYVNQRTTDFSARYTFSAKEKDAETGYSYFGSRYYSSDLSIWLSVDPMADKYPSLSPYVYCADNPVRLVDPNGEEIWIPGLDEKGNVTYTAEKGDSFDSFIHQFDCRGADGKNKAREIFANARLKSDGTTVKEGTEINGEDVKKATGSDVLKGNWHNMTNSQKASQLIFAIRYSACHGDWYFDLRDFVNGFQIGGGGLNFSASNVPDGNGGFIQIHNISVGCTYDNTVMTTGLFWNEDSGVNRDIYSTHNIYNNSPGHRPMIMFTLDKGNENSERFIRMVRCK